MSPHLRYGDPEEVGMSAERVRRVAYLAKGWVEEGAMSALVVLAARRGVIVLHEAFGRLTPEVDSPPVELDTVFPMLSISKPITATLAMILVDDGLLGLNRPVQEYIPEFVGEGKDQVMVYHLLTHTSGLTDDDVEAHLKRRNAPGLWTAFAGRSSSPADWVRGGLDAPLTRQPGLEMSYCNYGMELLGEIVQRVSGESLEAFARRRLFDPLEMNSTSYVVPESADGRVVRRPPYSPSVFTDAEWWRRSEATYASFDAEWFLRSPFASGGVFSTASDLAAFGQMLLERGAPGRVRILSRASVAEMTRNQIPGIGARYRDELLPEASWGLGWSVDGGKKALRSASLRSERAVSHGGAGGVYLWIDPAYDLVGVYLSVCLDYYATSQARWNADLFANAVTAAIVDV